MKEERNTALKKYFICFIIASLIAVIVFSINGFFTDDIGVDLQILSDGFFVSGILFVMFAGLMYISGEGALIGISFVMRNVLLWFVPAGRLHQETYAQYRERKLGTKKRSGDHSILITGLLFLAVGVILTVVWDANFNTSGF